MPKPVESEDELDDEAMECRGEGHRWPRRKHTRKEWTRARGGVVVEERRYRDCEVCGATVVATWEIRTDGEWYLKDRRMAYPTDRAYLVKVSEAQPRLTRARALGILNRRENPRIKFGR